ncbi:hypothetical protein GCM10027612_76470 [Microbispora bryophytorum subsp. camponoti]
MAEEHVQSLARGLAVIRAFDAASPELTLSEVARKTGLTRAAARRFLLTLAGLGYVRTDGRLFSLSPRVLELGYAYLSSLSLPEVALPHLERLAAEVHESASVSVLDDTDIVYVARVPTARIMRVTIAIGTRFPAYCTSMGRVLLAGLPRRTSTPTSPAPTWNGSPRTPRPRRSPCAPPSTTYGPRAGPWWTRNWRRGCARSPRRSGTAAAGWSRRSTSPRTPAAPPWSRPAATCSPAARHRRQDRGRPARYRRREPRTARRPSLTTTLTTLSGIMKWEMISAWERRDAAVRP